MNQKDTESVEPPSQQPWIVLRTSYDVEAWIDNYNRTLQQYVNNRKLSGYGVCFFLAHGGQLFMHTTSEGDIVLDVTPEAEWITPLIIAATGADAPTGQLWNFPGHTLTQLILGMSSLIESTQIVLNHEFSRKKY